MIASMLGINNEPTILRAWGRIGTFLGIQDIRLAETTSEAEEMLQTRSFEIIFCRFRMTPENGVDFMIRLRAGGLQVPVIFIASHPDSRGALLSSKAAPSEFLPAPFTLDELTHRIQLLHHPA